MLALTREILSQQQKSLQNEYLYPSFGNGSVCVCGLTAWCVDDHASSSVVHDHVFLHGP